MASREIGVTELNSLIEGKTLWGAQYTFVDEIIQLNQDSIGGCFRFDPNLWFYGGHFPGNPLTPGVILTESMVQVGILLFGRYLQKNGSTHRVTKMRAEFLAAVPPGELVLIRAEKKEHSSQFLRVYASMSLSNGSLATTAEIEAVVKEEKFAV